jgi:hypothetical protein
MFVVVLVDINERVIFCVELGHADEIAVLIAHAVALVLV